MSIWLVLSGAGGVLNSEEDYKLKLNVEFYFVFYGMKAKIE